MTAVLASVLLVWAASTDPPPLEPVGRLDVREIPEASGIVKSRRYPGIFWVHNDSGNPPELFAIRASGQIVRRFRLEVPNIDWEDITTDDAGHLYVGDIGNNAGVLPLRAIYRIDEPDPAAPADGPLKATAASFYAVPKSNRFDAESLIYDQGTGILVTKYRDGREAELFSIPLEPPAPLPRPAQPRAIGRLPGFIEAATGADLSADRTLLAVCSGTVTRIYRRGDGQPVSWELAGEVRDTRPCHRGHRLGRTGSGPGCRRGRDQSPAREDLARLDDRATGRALKPFGRTGGEVDQITSAVPRRFAPARERNWTRACLSSAETTRK